MRIIHLARKPLSESSVAANVVKHGTGGLNIDGGRIAAPGEVIRVNSRSDEAGLSRGIYGDSKGHGTFQTDGQKLGRWPNNVILQHLPGCRERCDLGCSVADLDLQSGATGASAPVQGTESSQAVEDGGVYSPRGRVPGAFHQDKGGASRFHKLVGGTSE